MKQPTERDKQAASLQALAAAVAAALGWSYVRPDCDRPVDLWASIVRDGARLVFYFDTWKKRIRISGAFPRDFAPYGKTFEITVAADRPAAAVAKDIERRLLPEYLPAAAQAIERQADWDNRNAAARALTKELAAMIGSKPDGGDGWRSRGAEHSFRLYGTGGELEGFYLLAEVSTSDDNAVDFRLNRCSIALARDLLQTIRRFAGLPETTSGPRSARLLFEEKEGGR